MNPSPQRIGRYEIVRPLGQGGMGTLYLAFDPKLDRQIAIKTLRGDDEELRERLSREARAVAGLRHPHIVTIFDVGEEQGEPYIAMEYIEGVTLAAVIRDQLSLSMAQRIELMEELCHGLAYAHRAGIVHRDIKPANLMVGVEGHLKILDFGIARSDGSGLTQDGRVLGTLNYMSPEQMTGKPIDRRSDIFAVGAVLYEFFCLRQAFPGGLTDGLYNRIVNEPHQPLSSDVGPLDSAFCAIVDRALEKDPERRYQDLDALRLELRRVRGRLTAGDDSTQLVELVDLSPALQSSEEVTEASVPVTVLRGERTTRVNLVVPPLAATVATPVTVMRPPAAVVPIPAVKPQRRTWVPWVLALGAIVVAVAAWLISQSSILDAPKTGLPAVTSATTPTPPTPTPIAPPPEATAAPVPSPSPTPIAPPPETIPVTTPAPVATPAAPVPARSTEARGRAGKPPAPVSRAGTLPPAGRSGAPTSAECAKLLERISIGEKLTPEEERRVRDCK